MIYLKTCARAIKVSKFQSFVFIVNMSQVVEDVEVKMVTEEDDDSNSKRCTRKKNKHYFEHHIRKILKQFSEVELTHQAKWQLNDLAIIVCHLLMNKLKCILNANRRKTISDTDIASATIMLFGYNELSILCNETGNKALKVYETNIKKQESKGQARHTKADLCIPPSLLERFLRTIDVHMSNAAPIFLAAVVQTFLERVIRCALSNDATTGRLSIEHLQNGVETDAVLSKCFAENNIYFCVTDQRVFPKTLLENRLKSVLSTRHPDVRFQKDCFVFLQDYMEKWILNMLHATNSITLASKKTRIHPTDIDMVHMLLENRKSFLKADES